MDHRQPAGAGLDTCPVAQGDNAKRSEKMDGPDYIFIFWLLLFLGIFALIFPTIFVIAVSAMAALHGTAFALFWIFPSEYARALIPLALIMFVVGAGVGVRIIHLLGIEDT
jgi:hypothetical protein